MLWIARSFKQIDHPQTGHFQEPGFWFPSSHVGDDHLYNLCHELFLGNWSHAWSLDWPEQIQRISQKNVLYMISMYRFNNQWWLNMMNQLCTLWSINIDPENHPFLVETNLPTPIFQGLCVYHPPVRTHAGPRNSRLGSDLWGALDPPKMSWKWEEY